MRKPTLALGAVVLAGSLAIGLAVPSHAVPLHSPTPAPLTVHTVAPATVHTVAPATVHTVAPVTVRPGGPIQPPSAITDVWTRLPNSPIRPRDGAAGVWTGSQLIIWGGGGKANGATFDPGTSRWTMLPKAPISGRTDPAYAFAHGELFVWGGRRDGRALHDGAVYRPATHSWHRLPAAPVRRWGTASAYVVGGKIVLLSTPAVPYFRTVRADVYDPAGNRWRALPGIRLAGQRQGGFLTAVAAGSRLFMWASWLNSAHPGNEITFGVTGLTLRPAAPRPWRHNALTLQRRPVTDPVWTGRQIAIPTMVGTCFGVPCPLELPGPGVMINPATGARTRITSAPVTRSLATQWKWTGRALLGFDAQPFDSAVGGAAAEWVPGLRSWVRLPRAPWQTDGEGVSVWTGNALLLWGKLFNAKGHRVAASGLMLGPAGVAGVAGQGR